MNTDVAKTGGEKQEVIRYSEDDMKTLGLNGLDRSDMKMPRLQLFQPQSQMDGTQGEIFNTLLGICEKVITVIVIRVGKGRVYWQKDFDRDADPICASDDCRKPREGISDPPSEACLGCVHSIWEDNKRPACDLVFNYMVVDIETGLPAMVTMSGTSAKTGKQLNALFNAFKVEHGFELSVSDLKRGSQGQWYEWIVRDAGRIDTDKAASYMALARDLASRDLTTDTGEDRKESVDKETGEVVEPVDDPRCKALYTHMNNHSTPNEDFLLAVSELGIEYECKFPSDVAARDAVQIVKFLVRLENQRMMDDKA